MRWDNVWILYPILVLMSCQIIFYQNFRSSKLFLMIRGRQYKTMKLLGLIIFINMSFQSLFLKTKFKSITFSFHVPISFVYMLLQQFSTNWRDIASLPVSTKALFVLNQLLKPPCSFLILIIWSWNQFSEYLEERQSFILFEFFYQTRHVISEITFFIHFNFLEYLLV